MSGLTKFRRSEHASAIASGAGITVAVVIAIAVLTATGSINFSEFISRVLVGMSYGSVYALLAVGLVLTYKTSGVFNLAYGAQAFVSGAIYYDLRVRHDWSIPAALLIALFIAAPLLGFILDKAVFRWVRSAPPIAKLVTSLALLVAIPQILKLWFGQNPASGTQGIVPNGDTAYHPFGDVFISRNDVATIAATLVVVGLLTVLFKYSADVAERQSGRPAANERTAPCAAPSVRCS